MLATHLSALGMREASRMLMVTLAACASLAGVGIGVVPYAADPDLHVRLAASYFAVLALLQVQVAAVELRRELSALLILTSLLAAATDALFVVSYSQSWTFEPFGSPAIWEWLACAAQMLWIQATVSGQHPALRAGTLLLVERSEEHEIRNTGKGPLQTLNWYVPPAYDDEGEPLPPGES